jgi:hypothetical protein
MPVKFRLIGKDQWVNLYQITAAYYEVHHGKNVLFLRTACDSILFVDEEYREQIERYLFGEFAE